MTRERQPPEHPPQGPRSRAAVIGGGPAGLMAAEVLSGHGVAVTLYDAMPSVGRKLLMAGKSGLNLTHSEDTEVFLARYGEDRARVEPYLRAFGPRELAAWAAGLGIETFTGSSGRIFPKGMTAAPLVRAWVRRLKASGVVLRQRHRWTGWEADGALRFETPDTTVSIRADVVVMALGGASWSRLGSDGAWAGPFTGRGFLLAPFRPANCGFEAGWSPPFRERFAGAPVKGVVLHFGTQARKGDFVVTETGIEGSLVYPFSKALREALEQGPAVPTLDLLPDRDAAWIEARLARPRGKASMSNHLRKSVGISGVKAGLLREGLDRDAFTDPARLAAGIKALPLRLERPRPLDEAISSAGGLLFNGLDENLMLRDLPGTFCAGEMLDWEAPTGGYLLSACFAMGRAAGEAAATWLTRR